MNRTRTTRPTAWMPALLAALVLTGCNNMPGQPEEIELKAQYTGLAGRSVAVVVSTSDYTDFNHPDARRLIAHEIARLIKVNVPDATLVAPQQILDWQKQNPYWGTLTPTMLAEQLRAERVVLVEIGEYRTHEPGDSFQLRGVISATVNVIEADAADPDNYAGSYPKTVMYPRAQDSVVGEVASERVNEQVIELQTQRWFCEETAGLFYDHTLIR